MSFLVRLSLIQAETECQNRIVYVHTQDSINEFIVVGLLSDIVKHVLQLCSHRYVDSDWWYTYWSNEARWRSCTKAHSSMWLQKADYNHWYCSVGLCQQS